MDAVCWDFGIKLGIFLVLKAELEASFSSWFGVVVKPS